MIKKKCSKCGVDKELSEFCKQKGRKYGVSSQCKECKKKYRQSDHGKNTIKKQKEKYWEENGDRVNAENREKYSNDLEYKESVVECNKRSREKNSERWNAKNRERYANDEDYRKTKIEQSKKSREKPKNKEKRKVREKNWRNENKEKIAKSKREYYLQNIKSKKEYDRKRHKENPEIARVYNAKRKAIRRRAEPKDLTEEDIKYIKDIYSKTGGDTGLDVDHIIPIQGLLPDGKRVLGAHRPSNLQVLTKKENQSKKHYITYDDLKKSIEGVDYIFVPDDYHNNPWKYPEIGFDV